MRQKLNENPVAQIVLLGVLVVVGGYLILSSLGGGGGESAEAEPSTTPATASSEGSAVAPEEASALEGAAPAAATSSVSAPASQPLPKDVRDAYAEDKTVVLLVYRSGGIDDALVAAASSILSGQAEVAFFETPVDKIARYSALTGPLGVNQAPALIVVSPKRLNGGAPAPATVSYGFQTPADIIQAVVDAGYKGPQLTYAPN